MDLPSGQTILNIVLFLVFLGLGWVILRAVLKVAARFLAVGCLALVAMAGIVWAIGWLR